jgi:cytochrome c nitrite reductase small subunit
MTDPRPGGSRRLLLVFPIALSVLLGVFVGLGTFTFGYAEGASYLSNDPTVCVNCHVMDPQYDSWQNGGHRHVAVCNDCHLPHDPIMKWVTKADNGFFHTMAFTLGGFHEPIQIKPRNRRVTQGACVYCHEEIVQNILSVEEGGGHGSSEPACIHCHMDAGHAGKE